MAARGDQSKLVQRWRAVLIGSEVVLCAIVVMVAVSLADQLRTLRHVDLGVRTDRTVSLWLNATSSAYADATARNEYYQRVVGELSRTRGVESVGAIDLPFRYDWNSTRARAGADKSVPALTALDRIRDQRLSRRWRALDS